MDILVEEVAARLGIAGLVELAVTEEVVQG
jgi:hypothetical protein